MGATLQQAKRKLSSFAKSGVKKTGAIAAAGGKALLNGFGFQGASFMTDAFEGIVDIERSLTRFQIATNASDSSAAAFRDTLRTVSGETGVGREKLLAAAHSYVAFTGDAKGATDSLRLFGQIANATGSPMEDIAGVAGSLRENLKLDPKDFRTAFDILTTQGKLGAVEIKDLAAELSNVAPMFSRFAGGTGTKGLAEMGAILQIMRKDFGGVEETATGFKSIMSQLARKSADLKNLGINFFDKKKNQRGFLEIVEDFRKLKAAGKLDQAKLIDVLGEQKAVNALMAVIDRRAELSKMVSDSANSNAIAKDSAKYMASAAGRLDQAWNNVKLAIADALTPDRINALASALTKAADGFVKVIGMISSVIDGAKSAGQAAARFVGGPSNEDLQNEEYNRFVASVRNTSQNLTPAQMREKADKLDKWRKEKVKGNGATGIPGADALYWGATDAAAELRDRADPWSSTRKGRKYAMPGGAGDFLKFGDFLNGSASDASSMRGMLADLIGSVRSGKASGIAGQAMTVIVKIGDDAVAKSVNNARSHRAKPGGR